MKRQVGAVDLTPTWVGVLPVYLAAWIDGGATARQMAREELLHMARVADLCNELIPAAEQMARDVDAMGSFYGAVPGSSDAVRAVLAKVADLKARA